MTENSDHHHHASSTTFIGLPEPVCIAHGLPFDVAPYRHFIADLGLSDDQERQMIETLAFFVLGFVDLGFGMHPAQQACGKVQETLANSAGTDSDGGRVVVDTLTSTFNRAASSPEGRTR